MHDEMLRKWKCQAFVHMQLQRRSHTFFRNIYNALTYPSLVLNIICSVIVNLQSSFGIRIAVSIMNIVATILTTVLRQMEPAERAQSHRDTAAQFNTLLHSIESCMNIPFYMRPEAKVFIKTARADLTRLIMTQTEPPTIVQKLYENQMGKVDAILYGQDIIDLTVNNMFTAVMMEQLRNASTQEAVRNGLADKRNKLVDRMVDTA